MKTIKKSVSKFWEILGPYLFRQKHRFVFLIFLQISAIAFTLILPQIMKYFIDSAKSGAAEKILILIGIAYIGTSLIQQISSVLTRYSGEVLAWAATNQLRFDLAEHCLSLDMSFHNEKSPGELIERIDGDVQAFSNFFSQLVIRIAGNLILLSGVIIVLFFEDWKIGVLFLLFAMSTLLILHRVRNVAVPYVKARRDAVTALFAFIEERLAGAEDIKANGGVSYVIHGLYHLSSVLYKAWKKAALAHIVIRLAARVAMVSGFALSMLGGFYLYKTGILTIGSVYMIIQYTQAIGRPIRIITRQIENLQNVGANVGRIHQLKNETGLLKDTGINKIQGLYSVEFKNISFSYRGDEQVLKNISFKLPKGQVLGLLGRTGSGKSTIGRLLCCFYDPQEGIIYCGKDNIKNIQLKSLRRNIAYVTQEVQLFQASIRDNLTFFNQQIPDSKLLEVIETLGLTEWLDSLSDGLNTKLKSGNKGLSAGQAQLLAFTRVFLRDPGLVILDEASSRLDPATERLLEYAMDRLLKNRTAVIIAHRLTTLDRADLVLLLEAGSAAEFGSRDALLADPDSKFSELLKKGFEEVLV